MLLLSPFLVWFYLVQHPPDIEGWGDMEGGGDIDGVDDIKDEGGEDIDGVGDVEGEGDLEGGSFLVFKEVPVI